MKYDFVECAHQEFVIMAMDGDDAHYGKIKGLGGDEWMVSIADHTRIFIGMRNAKARAIEALEAFRQSFHR